eukprot:TRINITY_DN19314_c0_g1_i1.p1 TRINITY_DN19314_c0_g1~~TRINITY_DN19314_c0_g1_i1.p1  ORF type:complete len:960 (+),score=435.36 TRINITY_DN19314_c0_g1_i1:53-2881(+)
MAEKYRPGAFSEAGELRVDRSDGEEYTREDFIACYGGTVEWHAAKVDAAVLDAAVAQMPDFASALDAFAEGEEDATTFYFRLREAFGRGIGALLEQLEQSESMSVGAFTQLASAVKDVGRRTQRLAATLTDIAGDAVVKEFRTKAVVKYNAAPVDLPVPLQDVAAAYEALDPAAAEQLQRADSDEAAGILQVASPTQFPTACARKFYAALVEAFGDAEAVFEDLTATLPSLKKQRLLRFARAFAGTYSEIAAIADVPSLPLLAEYVFLLTTSGAEGGDAVVRACCCEVLHAGGAKGVAGVVAALRGGDYAGCADALHAVFQQVKQERSGALIGRLTELAGPEKLKDFRTTAMKAYVKAADTPPEGLRAAAKEFVASLRRLVGGADALSDALVEDMALLLPSDAKQEALLLEARATPSAVAPSPSLCPPSPRRIASGPLLALLKQHGVSADAFHAAHVAKYAALTKAGAVTDGALDAAAGIANAYGADATRAVAAQIASAWLSEKDKLRAVKARRLLAAYATMAVVGQVEAAWDREDRVEAGSRPSGKTVLKEVRRTLYEHASQAEDVTADPDAAGAAAMALWQVLVKVLPGGVPDAAEMVVDDAFQAVVGDRMLASLLGAAAQTALEAALVAREQAAADEAAKEVKKQKQQEAQYEAQRVALFGKELKTRNAVIAEETQARDKLGKQEVTQRAEQRTKEARAAKDAEDRKLKHEEKERRKREHEEKERAAKERKAREDKERAEEQQKQQEAAAAKKKVEEEAEAARSARMAKEREEALQKLKQQREAEKARKEEEKKEHERQLEREIKKAAKEAKNKSRKEREEEEREKQEAALRRKLEEDMKARDAEQHRRETHHKQHQKEIQKNRDRKQNAMNVATGGGGGGGAYSPSPGNSPAHHKKAKVPAAPTDWPHMPTMFWVKEPRCANCNAPLNGQACKKCIFY